MDSEKYTERIEQIQRELLNRVDFKSGVIQDISSDEQETGCILDVRWKGNVHLVLQLNRWNGGIWYDAQRNGEQVSCSHYASKTDDKFFHSVQHLVDEIETGTFHHKKTVSEQIEEIICARQLTCCMNNTKWNEFVKAMAEEMSIQVPYAYKTLLEVNSENLYIDVHYDRESFNWYHFKSIEWVKIQPKFYERQHRGRLIEDEKIYHDAEEEFLTLMNKYSIAYEYDAENELYTIYGYR